jgi:uncharacterized membrane protein HdeD (DUF308 family)
MSGSARKNPLTAISGWPLYHLFSGIFFIIIGIAFFYYFRARNGFLYSGLFMLFACVYGLFRIFIFAKKIKNKDGTEK